MESIGTRLTVEEGIGPTDLPSRFLCARTHALPTIYECDCHAEKEEPNNSRKREGSFGSRPCRNRRGHSAPAPPTPGWAPDATRISICNVPGLDGSGGLKHRCLFAVGVPPGSRVSLASPISRRRLSHMPKAEGHPLLPSQPKRRRPHDEGGFQAR